jgi:hypothetical protein
MDKKIFFSYGHDEYKDFVLKIQKYLEQEEGFQVFVDSDKLRMGDDWEYKLEKAIEENSKMVFFITKHAARRPDGYCLNKISMALAHNKKVFPVMLEEHILPLSLIRKQYLDLRSCITEGEVCDEGIFEEQVKYLINVLNDNSDLEHGDIQQKLIQKLKPIDFQSDYARHGRIIGRKWIMDEVDDWLETKPTSKVLWITAEAGYGKSAISAYLARHPKVMSVHFCNYNSPDTQDSRSVVKTLAYNLQAQQIEGYREEIQHVDVDFEGKNAFELFRDLIANPLSQVKKEGSEYLFVIDALDETLDDENLELITLLGSDEFHWGLPDFVKIIITSRPESKIKQAISKYNPLELKADRKENKDDCKKYIEVKLSEYNRSHVENNERLVDVIMENSSANMLYLTKFFEDDTLDLSQPDKFPKDLQEIYWRFFRRITKDKNEYDENLAPILEIMLSYGESIPKLLLQDILGLSMKDLKRRFDKLGSMIRKDEGVLDFYHKSLCDWLVSKDNEDYFVDKEEGQRKILLFIERMTKENYKEEYLDFEYLNRMLVDTAYEKEKSLNRFFGLTSSIKNLEKIINVLDTLGQYYYVRDNMYKAIELYEKNLNILQPLYTENSAIWIEDYSIALNNLATAYIKINKTSEAIDLFNKNLSILQPFYIENSEYWVSHYISSIINLAASYELINKTSEAINLYKKGLDILQSLYRENSKRWVSDYTKILMSMAIPYNKINRVSEAINFLDESFNIVHPLYEDNPEKWIEHYVNILDNLAFSYANINMSKVIELLEERLKILYSFYIDNSEYWTFDYTKALSDLAVSYEQINKVSKAEELLVKCLGILQPCYNENPERWVENYIDALKNLASSYDTGNRLSKAIELYNKSLNILQPCYNENPERWVELYTEILNDSAISYAKTSKSYKAIELLEESMNIRQSFYIENPERWSKSYIFSIDNLVDLYKKEKSYDKAKKLKKKSRDILQRYEVVFETPAKEPNRNDPCPCGSGKKYKKCCGKN